MEPLFCFVDNGVVQAGPTRLPQGIDPDTCIQSGWYPFIFSSPLTYDRLNEREAVSFGVTATHVDQVRQIVPLTPEEKAAIDPMVRNEFRYLVNNSAGSARAKFITVVPGQEATYLWKEQEAQAWQSAASPVATDYPILHAEALACDMTLADVATNVLSTAAQWRAVAAQIEGVRRGALVAIERATTSYELEALTLAYPVPE